jgi:predicted nucleotidyltransferase
MPLIVDLTDLTRSLTPTLDGPVLAVLAQSGRPLTVGEIAARAARGSEIGVRRVLARLVEQGIVQATEMGRNRVHELNREHISAAAAELFAGLRLELWKRLREELAGWDPQPLHAAVFGSAARGDGGPESDIDLLLVRPPVAGETLRQSPNLIGMITSLLAGPAVKPLTEPEAEAWRRQVDQLHEFVRAGRATPSKWSKSPSFNGLTALVTISSFQGLPA